MKNNIVILNPDILNAYIDKKINGDQNIFWLILNYFLKENYKVFLVLTEKNHKRFVGDEIKYQKKLFKLGVVSIKKFTLVQPLHTPDYQKNSYFRNIKIKLDTIKYQKIYSKKISDYVTEIEPKFILSFSEIFPLHYFASFPLVVWGLYTGFNVKEYSYKKGEWFPLGVNSDLSWKIWKYYKEKIFAKSVKNINLALVTSRYEGEINRKIFNKNIGIIDFYQPAFDLMEGKKIKIPKIKKKIPKIILIGTVSTTYAKANIDYLIDEIYPYLKKVGKLNNFLFEIIGDNKNLPRNLKELMKRQRNIILKGFVKDLGKEILNASAVMHAIKYAPTSGYKLGNICSAYPILILHKNTFSGFPNLFKNKACLCATTPEQFIRKIEIANNNTKIASRLRLNARLVYEKYFSETKIKNIMDDANMYLENQSKCI